MEIMLDKMDRKIIETLKLYPNFELNKNDIAKIIFKAKSTTQDHLTKLVKEGILVKQKKLNGKVGAPKVMYKINANRLASWMD